MEQHARPRVLLADDHTVVAEGVRALLARDFELVGVARDGREVVHLALERRPDIIVLDIAMPVLNGLDAAAQLRQRLPGCPIVFMSGHDSLAYVRAAVRSGAAGYVAKARAEELPDAIHAVLRGKTYFPPELNQHELNKAGKSASPLSPREREILQLVAEGKAGKEIAAIAGVSVRTVEFHKYNIMNKLSLRSTAELTRYALQQGMIEEAQ